MKRNFLFFSLSLCLSVYRCVCFLFSCTFYIQRFLFPSVFFFLLRDICSYIKIIHHNFTTTFMHTNHMQLIHFCCACIHLSFVLLSLVFWLSLPTSHSFSFFSSSKYVRFHGVFIGCSRSYLSILYFALSLSFFLLCASALS